jgi:hypothetical protein
MILVVLCLAISMVGVAFGIALTPPLLFTSLLACVFFLSTMTRGDTSALLTKLVAWIDGGRAVKMIDMHGQESYTIVSLVPNSNNWIGPAMWGTNIGEVILLPNGYVHPGSACSYIFVWQPLDPSWATELSLTYPEFPDWEELKTMSAEQQYELKRKHDISQS